MRGVVACGLLLLLGMPLRAQGPAKGVFPEGYRVRPDDAQASVSNTVFVAMAPGWHITTGPAAVLYSSSNTASGAFRLSSESYLFDPGARNEAYGVVLGARGLEGGQPSYVAFVIRRSGEFAVLRCEGGRTGALVPWSASAAIVRFQGGSEGTTAKNVLQVDAGADSVRFLVNDQRVAALARGRVAVDGVVGLRVGENVNLHVTSLDVSAR